jgi:hypothetical protein
MIGFGDGARPKKLGSDLKSNSTNLGLDRKTKQLGTHLGPTLFGSRTQHYWVMLDRKTQHHWVMLSRMTKQLGTHLGPASMGHTWQKVPVEMGPARWQGPVSLSHG